MTREIEILTPDEVAALVSACSHRSATGLRSRALITLMYRSGARVQEALDLRPRDLDLRTGSVTLHHGKGDKRRVVGLDPEACAVVGQWLDRRKALGLNGHQPLFCTLKGTPIYRSNVRDMLVRLGHKAGIDKRLHPHALRHSAAVLAAQHLPAHVVQRMLGHTSLLTTSRYLDHLTGSEVVDAMRSLPWQLEREAADASS